MARTKNQLIDRALRRLGVLDADESASGSDLSYCAGEYDTMLERLRDDGLAYWPNTNGTTAEIPDVVFDGLASVLAGRVSVAFGKAEMAETDEATGEQMPISAAGYRKLRRHIASRHSGEAVKAVYF
jgi:hypothetical protein